MSWRSACSVARYEPLLRSVCAIAAGWRLAICAERRCSDAGGVPSRGRVVRGNRRRTVRWRALDLDSRALRRRARLDAGDRAERANEEPASSRDPAVDGLVRDRVRTFVRELPRQSLLRPRLSGRAGVSRARTVCEWPVGRAACDVAPWQIEAARGRAPPSACAAGASAIAACGRAERVLAARSRGACSRPSCSRGWPSAPPTDLARSRRGCARPAGARGRSGCGARSRCATGTVTRRVWSTDTEPDGVLRKACGNRREAVCPPCAERYRQDAYHLIAAGLRGGKGVPESIAEHPAVFVTLTAPSFGVVHTRPLGPTASRGAAGRGVTIRSARTASRSRAARSTTRAIRASGSRCAAECFDYSAAVTWNNTLGELWRYTTIYVPRALARLAGMTQAALKREVRVAYVKVAEYQRRGLVHLHVLARLDRAMPDYRAEEIRPPRAALRRRAARARDPRGRRRRLRAGPGRAGRRARALGRPARRAPARPPATRAARSPATWPSTRPRAPSRPAGCCTASPPTRSTRVHVREHVRSYMRAAFALDATAPRSARTRRSLPGAARARRRDRLEPSRARHPRCSAR